MRFMQIESVLQTKNRSGPAKNRFSVALSVTYILWSNDFTSYHEDYLMEKCCTSDNGSV